MISSKYTVKFQSEMQIMTYWQLVAPGWMFVTFSHFQEQRFRRESRIK